MRMDACIRCDRFSCPGVRYENYVVPTAAVKPERVSIILVSEAAPGERGDYYYAPGQPLFAETTVQAFRDAGASVKTMRDILNLGVYLTTAVKCGKTEYRIPAAAVRECSTLLEREIALFPNVKAFLLMGDVAITALNDIGRRQGVGRVIPAGSTYKIRKQVFRFHGARVFPSYLQAGPSFYIEKSKRTMIAEDIAAALQAAG